MEKVDNIYKQIKVVIYPCDWEITTIGDIADVVGGGTPSTFNNDYWNGQINWFTPTEIGISKYSYESLRKISKKGLENSSAKILPIGTILLTSRAGIGDVSILMKEGCTNQGFQSLVINERTNNQFVYYLISTLKRTLLQYASGSTFLEISPSKIRAIQVALPPLKEQAAIATALSDVDSLIENLEKLVAKKQNIKQGIMQELLRPKEDWVEKVLSDTATLKARIGWQGLTTAEYKKSGDFYLITGTEFKNGYIDWDNCFYVDAYRYQQDKNIQVKQHDVLVTKDGTIGKVALIKSVPKPATLNSGVFVIRPINYSFHPEFFYFMLLSEIFTKFLSQLSAGSTINHLYQKDFVTFRYLTPKTYDEQERIAKVLNDIDSEIYSISNRLAKYEVIKQGIMQTLLTGKIRLI